ncbi:MAG: carboxypeptidase regulatory-like domain-containing protein, partial [Nitrospira sp.]
MCRSSVLVIAAWLCSFVPTASSYDIIEVQHGGTLDGRVTLSGSIPEPKGFNLITFPDPSYCGRISNGKGWRLLYDFTVASDGGLKNAIVTLEGVESGKPFDLSVPLIEARD